ncbi:MAG: hypothetical protein GVY25_08105 [Bacteroidetes bacterium]|jgi:hypothetical protein|nr:hypothetical protein [Bacteroidota bacterium]
MPRFFASLVLCLFLVLPANVVTAQSGESTFSNRSLTYAGLFVTNDPGQYAMGAARWRFGAVREPWM